MGPSPSSTLVRRAPFAAREHGDESLQCVVRLVDDELFVGHELAQRVGDPLQERVEALLRENLVEDVREPTVRVDERLGARELVDRLRSNEAHRGCEVVGSSVFSHAHTRFLRFSRRTNAPREGLTPTIAKSSDPRIPRRGESLRLGGKQKE